MKRKPLKTKRNFKQVNTILNVMSNPLNSVSDNVTVFYFIIIFGDGEILYKGIICPIIDPSCCIIVTWKFRTTSQWFSPYQRACLKNDQKTKRSITAVLAFNVKYCFLRLALYCITYCMLQLIKNCSTHSLTAFLHFRR